MREKKSGALSKVQKIKKRLSHSFGRLCEYPTLFFFLTIFSVMHFFFIGNRNEKKKKCISYRGTVRLKHDKCPIGRHGNFSCLHLGIET